MRKSRKYIVVGGTVAGLMVGGAAYAYWTTSGSGSGSGSTTAGVASAVTIHQESLNAMYPGDGTQGLKLTAQNTDLHQSAFVTGVKVTVTTDQTGCTGGDFLINGTPAVGQVSLNWTGVEVPADTTSATQNLNTIQFNDKAATDQSACKNAAVTLTYASN